MALLSKTSTAPTLLKFNASTLVADLCKSFNKAYPYLRLELYKRRQTYLPEERSLVGIDKTIGEISKKVKGLASIDISPNRKALDVIADLEQTHGLHAMFAYYVYDWCGDSRGPVRMASIFEPEDEYCFTGSMKALEEKSKKKKAIPNCW